MMRFDIRVRFVGLILGALLGLTCQVAAQEITITTDDAQAAYASGETARIRITTDRTGNIQYRVRHSLRNFQVLAEGSVALNGGTTEIPFSFDGSGFVTIEANVDGSGFGAAGATFAREDIRAFADEPADFDEFWRKQYEDLAEVPVDLQLDFLERREYSTSYQFSAAQVDGRRVYGYIVVPDGDGPFPATLELPAFGSGPRSAVPETTSAERAGCIAMSISIHNAPPEQGDPLAYKPENWETPERIYYRYALMAAARALDVLEARDDWNGRDLCVFGNSQGGGLAMLLAGIDERPTLLVQSNAALSQHAGFLFDRPAGFPYYLEGANFNGYDRSKVAEAVGYYETAFAVRRYTGPSLHFVNYLDDVCPPATQYAAQNELPGSRVALHSLNLDHSNAEEYFDSRLDFLREHFAGARSAPFPFAPDTRSHFIDAGGTMDANTLNDLRFAPRYGKDTQEGGDANWTVEWNVLDGPGEVQFSDRRRADSRASFSTAGTYKLRLRVIDPYTEEANKFWELTDVLTVEVTDATSNTVQGVAELVFSALPNPATNNVVVSFESARNATDAELLAVDANGRTIFRTQINAQSAASLPIDVSTWPAGIYTLQLRSATGDVATQRLVVTH